MSAPRVLVVRSGANPFAKVSLGSGVELVERWVLMTRITSKTS